LKKIVVAPGQSKSAKLSKPVTKGSKCYHNETHGFSRESVTGWCLGCLLSLIKEKEVVSLSHHVSTTVDQPSPLTALGNLLTSLETERQKKFSSVSEFIDTLKSLAKAPTNYRGKRRVSYSKPQ
jgi:hypothetical protein